MSCRSTHLSSAITSLVNYYNPNTTDKKVQVLFHSLKREGKEAVAPTEKEYFEAIDKILFRLRNNSLLSEAKQSRVIRRLEEAYFDPIPDGATWYAINNILSQSSVEMQKARIAHLVKNVAQEIDIPEDTLTTRFSEWMNPESIYEEVSAPDSQYQYENDEETTSDPHIKRALRRLGYEHYLAQPYPVFVYGSLRAGEPNHRTWIFNGAVDEILEAKGQGLALYSMTDGYPNALETEGGVVQGDLLWLNNNEAGKDTRKVLDRLEGFHSDVPSEGNYTRVLKEVEFLGEEGLPAEKGYAWVYVASERQRTKIDPKTMITSGNWLDTHSDENREKHRAIRIEDLRNGNQPILTNKLDASMIE